MSLYKLSAAAGAFAAAPQLKPLPFNPDQVAHFVDGLLDGLVQENNFDKIKVCLKDQEVLAPELKEVIDSLKKKDIIDIIHAVTVVGQMLTTVDKDLSDCAGMLPDLLRIRAWATIFKDPIKLFRVVFANSLANIDKIHGDIGKIITDVGTDDLHGLGEEIADILVLQLGPVPKLNDYYAGVFGQQPSETLY